MHATETIYKGCIIREVPDDSDHEMFIYRRIDGAEDLVGSSPSIVGAMWVIDQMEYQGAYHESELI